MTIMNPSESAGKAKDSFDAEGMEGLFGSAVFSGKMQIISDIPEDTRYVFESPGYQFVPRKIITVPVFSGHKMLAMISLACVSSFKEGTTQLIEDLMDTMNARIEGVLAYRTIQRFSNLMEEKNRELDAQKEELAAQAAALSFQNSELEIQKEQLEEASRLKTSFLSNMSHELRTPAQFYYSPVRRIGTSDERENHRRRAWIPGSDRAQRKEPP